MAYPEEPVKFDVSKYSERFNSIPYIFENAGDPSGYQVRPSEFRKEILLSTEERYEKLLVSHVKPPQTELNFQPFKLIPHTIIFQCFQPSSVYTIPLTIRNISHVLRPLRICFRKTPYFDVITEATNINKPSRIAPGMSAQYNVKFFPTEDIDYTHKITFFTEGGTFRIPIIAIGSRPILDIPDSISIPIGAVNIPSEKTISIRNLGSSAAIFKFVIDPPFYVTPMEGILVQSEILQLKLEYKSETAGKNNQRLILRFDNGEQLYIEVSGGANNINVYLDHNFIRMDSTYLQLSTQKKLKIFNKSDYIVKFAWKQYKNKNIQDEEKLKYEKLFSTVCASEKIKTNKLEFYDILEKNRVDVVEERIYHDELLYLEKSEEFLYINSNFSIIPLIGEIWPNNYCEVMIVFRPTGIYEYSSIAYCEITGQETRFALDMKGEGMGPTVVLNVVDLEIGFIFLCSPHEYEIVLQNKSHIPATVEFLDQPTVFGGKITCDPMSCVISPYENHAFAITFSSTKQGEFIEDIKFKVEESEEILTCALRGKVLTPKIKFDYEEINFDVVSIGFSVTKTVKLCNSTSLSVHYSLRLLNDGSEPPLTVDAFASTSQKPQIPINPREISFDHTEGDAPEDSEILLKVTLTPNRAGVFSLPLLLDMWETETETEQLTLKWNCIFPTIECEPQIIDLPFCFLNYVYNRTITITNRSDVIGYFYIIPQKIFPDTSVIVSLALNELYISGGGSIEIPFTVVCTKLGQHNVPLSMLIFGQQQPGPLCMISCKGQGPVISLDPEEINFGIVNLLQEDTRDLKIISDAPIPANFKVSFDNPHSLCKATPNEGYLLPGSTMNIKISIELCDTGIFHDKINVSVVHGCTVTCDVTAKGLGSSIAIEPNISPEYDFGPLFASKKYQFKFTVYNRGFRLHRITIRREMFKTIKPKKSIVEGEICDDKCPFRIVPDKICLAPKTHITIQIEVYKNCISKAADNYYLEASIEGQQRKELIGRVMLKAEFVNSTIEFSTRDLHFRVDKGVEHTFYHIQDSFNIINKTIIPLFIDILVDEPFYVLDAIYGIIRHCETDILTDETQQINIYYQCNDWNKLRSYTIDRNIRLKFKDSNNEEVVNLHADVYFPNISLQPPRIDFGCIENGVHAYIDLEVSNVSPLAVYYTWKWKESSFRAELLDVIDDTETTAMLQLDVSECADVKSESQTNRYVGNNPQENHASLIDTELGEMLFANYETPKSTHGLTVENKNSKIKHAKIDNDIIDPKRLHCFLKNICFELCHSYFEPIDNQELSVYNKLQKQFRQNYIMDLFDVTPYYGTLEPFEIQTIRIAFHPHTPIKVFGELECHIQGGPTETVIVTAMSSSISYNLETRNVDFGRQVFCAVCVKMLTLTNTGLLGFNFYISRPTFGETPPTHYILEAGWMTVEPRKGYVEPNSSIKLIIRYFPGIAGKFSELFEIQIGHDTPVIVHVNGYGVFPQIYISLPRPSLMDDGPITLGYNAIASLSMDWLADVQNIKLNNMKDFKEYYDRDVPLCDRVELAHDGWDVLSFNEYFPSKMDIELALERFIAYRHIENHPEILLEQSKSKGHFIHNFYVPNYIIDFGPVILESTVTQSIIILNYGPTPANIRLVPLSNNSGILSSGLTIQFQNVSNLHVGEICSMYIIFHPKYSVYPKRINNIKYLIYLEVDNGARVPIQIQGAVTVPSIVFEPENLRYEFVKCGECHMKSLILRNEGLIPCTWKARLCKTEKERKTLWEKIRNKSPNEKKPKINLKQFCIANGTSGVILPNDSHHMYIRFEPKVDGCQDVKLVITLEHNKHEKFTAFLKGYGIIPALQISHTDLEWPPILPYANVCKKIIVRNPNDFCVEYYLPEFDSIIHQDEQVIKLLSKAFNIDHVHLPPRDCGEPMPHALNEFYRTVIDELTIKIVNERWYSYDTRGHSGRHAHHGGSSTLNLNKKHGSQSKIGPPASSQAPVELGTPEEIEAMIYDFVKEGFETGKFGVNPIEKVWNEYNEASMGPSDSIGTTLTPAIEDIMIVFHGAPLTDYVYTAHKVGKALDLDVINVDMLVIECLLDPTPNSPHARKIKQILNFIDVNYNIQMERYKKSRTAMRDENPIEESDNEVFDDCTPDPIGALLDKVTFILNPQQGDILRPSSKKHKERDKMRTPSKTTKDQSPKASPTPKKDPSPAKTDKSFPSRCKRLSELRNQKDKHTEPRSPRGKKQLPKEPAVEEIDADLQYIPPEFIVDLLKERMVNFKKGIVIETLKSVFISSPTTLLECLLGIKGNIRYLHVIMFGLWRSSLDDYFLLQQDLLEKKQYGLNELQFSRITEMTMDEYESLSNSQRELYQNVVLQDRRNYYQERLNTIHQQIAVHLNKLRQDRNKKTMRFFTMKKKTKRDAKLNQEKKSKSAAKEKNLPRQGRSVVNSAYTLQDEYVNLKRTIFPKIEEWENESIKIIEVCSKHDKTGTAATNSSKISALKEENRKELSELKRQPSRFLKKGEPSMFRLKDGSARSRKGKRSSVSSIVSEVVNLGIPLWIVDCSNPLCPTPNLIVDFLKNDPDLKKALDLLHNVDNSKNFRADHKRCSIYYMPEKRVDRKQETECFSITNSEIEQDVFGSPRTMSDGSSQRSIDSKKFSPKIKKKKTDGTSSGSRRGVFMVEEARVKPRGILYPKSFIEYSICFSPKKLGNFEHKYLFETQGWPKAQIVTCKGYCEIPHIDSDPTKIFSIVKVSKEPELTEIDPIYYLSTQTLDFGGCLIRKPGSDRMALAKYLDLNLINVSQMECKLHFLLFGAKDNAFEFYPKKLLIGVGETEKVRIIALPSSLGIAQEQFGIFVKNNPHIELFKLSVQGAKFDCDFTEKRVNFERLLIFRKAQKTICIKNKSILEVLWRFVDFEDFKELGFDLSAIQGSVPPLSEIKIGIEYTGFKAQQIKYFLNYEIYEDKGRGEPFVKDKIEINAESFDVQIDVYFAQPEFTHIMFGDLKVSTIYKQKVGFFNRSIYPVEYKIVLIPNENHTKQVLMWGIEPTDGVLPKEILVPITIAILPKQSLALKKADIFMVHINDNLTKTRIAQFPLQVSFTSYYSEYEICPNILHFGPLLFDEDKVLMITLKNCGKFPFSYKIQGSTIDNEKKSPTENRQKAEKDKKSKGKDKKKPKTDKKAKKEKSSAPEGHEPSLPVGIFEIANFQSIVAPGEVKQIPITCTASEMGEHENKIQVFISECLPQFIKNGHVVSLKVNVVIPSVNLKNYDEMFRESYILKSLTDLMELPRKVGPYTVFIKTNDPALRFQQICLNKEFTTRIRIKNTGLIPAIIQSYLVTDHKRKDSLIKFDESDTNLIQTSGPFSITPKHLYIDPCVEDVLNITFHPISIQNYECDLLVNLVLPPFAEHVSTTIKLIGEVEIPQILIEEPILGDDTHKINFPLCLIGQQSYSKLVLKNVGNIPAKVSLHITDDEYQAFHFLLDENLEQQFVCKNVESENDSNLSRDVVLLINNDQTVKMVVIFDCMEVVTATAILDMFIIDNPFENKKIKISAEGFSDDMMIFGLPIKKLQTPPATRGKKGPASAAVAEPPATIYELDFGNGHVNELRTIYFTLFNCTDSIQLFEFNTVDPNDTSIVFSPITGYMAGRSKKDIVATYISKEPKPEYKGNIELKITEAMNDLGENEQENQQQLQLQPRQSQPQVDNKKMKTKLTASSKSVAKIRVQEMTEGEKESIGLRPIPGTDRKYLINSFAQIVYSEYTCLTENVDFKDTLLFERREFKFKVTNTAEVPLVIDWYLQQSFKLNNLQRNKSCPKQADGNYSNLLEQYRPPSARLRVKPRQVQITGNEKWLGGENGDVNLKKISSTIKVNDDYTAFNIIPDYVEIPPNEEQTFNIIFMPLDAMNHKAALISDIKYLSPAQQNITIMLSGIGLFPYCHFQTEFSDYITSERRDPYLPYLVGDWKVIELNLVGVLKTVTRTFKIINPTNENVIYTWLQIPENVIDETNSSQDINKFLCHKPKGTITKQRYDVAEFSFYPTKYGIFEDKYIFKIENYNWSKNFLFVANIREPNIYCQNSIIRLKPTICGIDVDDEIVLKNDENSNFGFCFDEKSICISEKQKKLSIEPNKGIIEKKSETSIKLTYKAKQSGDFIFDLRCRVNGLVEPLKIVVCGCCYKLDPFVSCTRMGLPREHLQIGKPYVITHSNLCQEFDEFMDFSIKNKGKTKFFYVWSFDVSALNDKFIIEIEPDKGHVKADSTELCTMLIKTLQKAHLKNIRLLLEIAYGPTYEILLNLNSLGPAYQFSFRKYNFGKCFIRSEPIWFYYKTLQFKNIDNIPLTLECITNATSFLKVDCDLETISPKETINIKIFFHPREKKLYKYIITFTVNSLPCDILFEGEGIDLMIGLLNSSDAVIDFGRVMIKSTAEKIVAIRNDSVAPVEVLVDIYHNLPLIQNNPPTVIKKPAPPSAENKAVRKPSGKGASASPIKSVPEESIIIVPPPPSLSPEEQNVIESFHMVPSRPVYIAPDQNFLLKILFSPEKHLPAFNQRLAIQMVNDVIPLSLITGEAVGLDVTLNRQSIPFGIVMKGCKLTSNFLLDNKGGIDVKFHWEFKKPTSHFLLEPMEGLICAYSTVKHTVTFCPQDVSSCLLRAEAICKIHGLKNQLIIFNGRCEDLPPATSNLVLQGPVRDTQISIISINNYTAQEWEITPNIWGEYFTCDEHLVIAPRMTGTCSIHYKPLTMTAEGESHKGCILFKYPTGKGELHNLIGIAVHPNAEDEKTYNLSAKKDHILQLFVRNWLPTTQRFTVITEQTELKPEKSDKKNISIQQMPYYKITGREFIEVPANWGKQYTWTFYGYNEGNLKFKVAFVNVETNEFLYYTLLINVTKCESLETFTISTPIRIPRTQDIIISNPTMQLIELDGVCSSPFVSFEVPFVIHPKDTVRLTLTYCPVFIENTHAKFELIAANNLGSYEYTLLLNGLPPVTEKVRSVITYLGKTETFHLEIGGCSSGKKYDYAIISSHPHTFIVPRWISVTNTSIINVVYDPSELGTTEGTIVADSPIAGRYTYPVQGTCVHPKPIGPFILKPKIDITFRNPFTTDQTFIFRGEPHGVINIVSRTGQEYIKAKGDKKITVSLAHATHTDPKVLVTGRVIIQAKNPNYTNITWTYYFQSDMPDN